MVSCYRLPDSNRSQGNHSARPRRRDAERAGAVGRGGRFQYRAESALRVRHHELHGVRGARGGARLPSRRRPPTTAPASARALNTTSTAATHADSRRRRDEEPPAGAAHGWREHDQGEGHVRGRRHAADLHRDGDPYPGVRPGTGRRGGGHRGRGGGRVIEAEATVIPRRRSPRPRSAPRRERARQTPTGPARPSSSR